MRVGSKDKREINKFIKQIMAGAPDLVDLLNDKLSAEVGYKLSRAKVIETIIEVIKYTERQKKPHRSRTKRQRQKLLEEIFQDLSVKALNGFSKLKRRGGEYREEDY